MTDKFRERIWYHTQNKKDYKNQVPINIKIFMSFINCFQNCNLLIYKISDINSDSVYKIFYECATLYDFMFFEVIDTHHKQQFKNTDFRA